MKIQNYNNFQSFGSIYKFQVERNNFDAAQKAQDKLYDKEGEIACFDKYRIYNEYPPYEESCKTGVWEKVLVSAADNYDEFIESVLKQHNITFNKQSEQEVLKPENIYNRIVLPKDWPNYHLVSMDTKTADELFKQDGDFYISKGGKTGCIGDRYQNFKNFLKTGRDIEASQVTLDENNGKIRFGINDGRHRFAVMRDMGMEKIKVAMDDGSYKLAVKYGLTEE